MPDPRRSNRAKAAQTHTTLQHSNTASSSSSNKADRTVRNAQRQDSNPTSMTPRSSPSDTPPSEPETRQTRQKRREQGLQDDEDTKNGEGIVPDDNVEDEDATRCICGEQEYPGVPIPLADWAKSQSRDTSKPTSVAGPREAVTEDPGSFFVQCDDCKVWQHAGCVGIMSEESCPENYYCEECRRALHKILTNAEGQRYSRYLPLYEPIATGKPASRKHPQLKEQGSRSSRNADSKNESSSAKKRSTMNSRATWEEEESFRRAVEASKTEDTPTNGNGRKAKRWREDSEETEQDPKRQKTSPKSESPEAQANTEAAESGDGDEGSRNRPNGLNRKARGSMAQERRDKEIRDRDKEKERERVEAASKRKGRAEKRHADDPEPSEEAYRAGANLKVVNRNAKGQVANKPSPAADAASNNGPQGRKNARTTARRRTGRNQPSRDKDGNAEAIKDSPRGSNSRDSDYGGSDGQTNAMGNGSKPSKPRYMNPTRTSMNDLRKRAAGILEYISRTQVEMAGNKTPPGGEEAPEVSKKPPVAAATINGASKLSNEVSGEGADLHKATEPANGLRVEEETFKKMNSLEMMDILTRELVHWQQDHGKYGEKAEK